jgi:hypothetical protein
MTLGSLKTAETAGIRQYGHYTKSPEALYYLVQIGANGNLYIAVFGRGDVTVLDRRGETIERIRIKGPLPTNLAFARNGERKIYVTEAQTGHGASIRRRRTRPPAARLALGSAPKLVVCPEPYAPRGDPPDHVASKGCTQRRSVPGHRYVARPARGIFAPKRHGRSQGNALNLRNYIACRWRNSRIRRRLNSTTDADVSACEARKRRRTRAAGAAGADRPELARAQ